MLYHNVMVPRYIPAVYLPPMKNGKKKKKAKVAIYAAPYKRKHYSFAYYLKYVLWKKIRRYWKKRKGKKKKKASKSPSISVLSNKGSEEKIDLRDFWGSKYGSQWLFAKQKQQQQHQVNRHHLIEIIDAFKTKDLKYANRHSIEHQRRVNATLRQALINHPGNKPPMVDQVLRGSPKCPCCRGRKPKDADNSEWSLSTARCHQRPYSKWPSNVPPGAKHCCGKEEQVATILSRQHAYMYNWLNVDQTQSRCQLAMTKEFLDKIRAKVEGSSRPGSRNHRRGGAGSQTSCACSDSGSCSSTLSRRERARILKRQRKAKEKASLLWLLSKAFHGHIPSDLKEPFYRDHDNARRLKPKIVHSLANAELYCLALVNIYSDPNYNNLDHQGVINALMRKGICLVESKDAPLTETTLVQTAPIRLNAHMSVIDGIMCLFIKEVLIPEKIVEVCRKFTTVDVNSEMPSNSEEAAVLWINKCCKTLEREIRSNCTPDEEKKLPKIPVLQEIADISDGCCLAAVISYYCPSFLRWQDIVWNDPMSLGDSIHNLQLIKKFCSECLPRETNFLTLEDLLYLHPSIKENVLAFVSDMLFMFVITKANCVSRKKETVPVESSRIPLENSKSLSNFPSHKSQALCSPIPNLRSDSYGGSTSSLPDIRPGSRTRNYGSKEKLVEKVTIKKSNLSSEEVEGPNQLQRTSSVGVVNGWKMSNLPYVGSVDSVSGSPRHTSSEMSRPAVEGESASSNFSQPSVSHEDVRKSNFAALNSPQRDQAFGLRKGSGYLHGHQPSGDANLANGDLRKGRKSLEDYYNQLAGVDRPLRSVSASNITENKGWRNCEKFSPRSQGGESVPESASSQSSGICLSDVDSKNNFSTTSFAQLSKIRDGSSSSINIVYMNHDKDGFDKDKHSTNSPSTPIKRIEGEGKKTTFAALPSSTTTWQQQHAVSAGSHFPQTDSGHETPTEPVDSMLNAQLCNIKMKLEDKKRKIELKKKRMELLWKRQRQKLGKAAFLQAVSKTPSAEIGTPDSGTGKEVGEIEFPPVSLPVIQNSPSLVKKMSIQDIAADLSNVQKKWLNQIDATEQLSLPDTTDFSLDAGSGVENVNIDLQTSIEHLNTSLTDLEADLSRICLQQEHVENLMKDSIDDCSHFFLHGQSPSDKPFKSPSRGHWQFNDSSFSFNKGEYSELNSKELPSYLSSPQRQESRPQFNSQPNKMSSFASLPPCPAVSKPPVAEELYSKVIKPENRQKVQSSVRTTVCSPGKGQPPKPKDSPGISSKPHVQSKTSTEIHIVLPQVPDSKSDDVNTGRKSKDVLYIPIEKEVKKMKPKTLKSIKAASDKSSVPNSVNVPNEVTEDSSSFGFVIGADLVHPDPETETEMARKKEMIMNMSIQRKAEYERRRAQKEQEYARLKEEERQKQESLERKREEEKKRREAILEQYRQRKVQEELEKEGISLPHKDTGKHAPKHRASVYQVKKNDNRLSMNFTKPVVELRNQFTTLRQNSNRRDGKPRPRSAYVAMNSDLSTLISVDNAANKRNSHIFQGRDIQEFDLDSLNSGSNSASSRDRPKSPNSSFPPHRNSNLQIPESSNPSSDGASDTASNGSSAAAIDYTGPKLFVKPTAKSNRGIIVNAINTVLAGAVNGDTKKKVLEEINRSESKHFLILFRDAGCQFRALYTYNPEREEVTKLYGIGPKNVMDKMMDRFYKYNSGGKCFSEIHTKHLTVTIDAFTIPNSLWAGKRVVPPKKEFL